MSQVLQYLFAAPWYGEEHSLFVLVANTTLLSSTTKTASPEKQIRAEGHTEAHSTAESRRKEHGGVVGDFTSGLWGNNTQVQEPLAVLTKALGTESSSKGVRQRRALPLQKFRRLGKPGNWPSEGPFPETIFLPK